MWPSPKGLPKRPPISSTVLISRVIDGDTFEIIYKIGRCCWSTYYKGNVRLLGVDAPEKNTPYGKAVKEWLTPLIEGKEATIELAPHDDKYGRILASLTLSIKGSRQSLAQFLLSHYAALPYDGGKKAEHSPQREEQFKVYGRL